MDAAFLDDRKGIIDAIFLAVTLDDDTISDDVHLDSLVMEGSLKERIAVLRIKPTKMEYTAWALLACFL